MDELARCIPTQSNSEPALEEDSRPDLDGFTKQRNVKFDSDISTVLSPTETLPSRTMTVTKRNSISLPLVLQPLADSRKYAPSSETLTNKFLTICPRDELTLNVIQGENDPVDIVALKNEGNKDVVYKIKITSPEKFRVRPSTGTIAAGKTELIRVHLQNEYKHTINREKFLIMAVEVGTLDSSDFATLWKNADESSKVEHRLRCRLARGAGSSPPSPVIHSPVANHTPHPFDFNDTLRQQVTAISQTQRNLFRGITLLIGLQILSLIFMFIMYTSIRSPQYLPAPQMSPLNVEPLDVDSDL